MKFTWTILAVLLACYAAAALFLYIKQRDFIYFPSRAVEHAYPLDRISIGDVTLDIVVLNAGQADAVVYFGGNAENVVFNAPEFLQWLPNRTLYLVNYRGYGGSTGQPVESALYNDAEQVFDNYRSDHTRVAVMGKSLGSGVATWLASVRDIEKLVLVTPYDSIANIASAQYPMFPVAWMLKDRFDSVARIAAIKAPTLVILAEHDNIIPASHSAALIAAFPPEQVQITTIAGADHNSLSLAPAYGNALVGFLDD